MGEAVLFDQHLMSIPILLRIQPSIPHKMLTLRLFVPKVHVHQTGKFLEILINKVFGRKKCKDSIRDFWTSFFIMKYQKYLHVYIATFVSKFFYNF